MDSLGLIFFWGLEIISTESSSSSSFSSWAFFKISWFSANFFTSYRIWRLNREWLMRFLWWALLMCYLRHNLHPYSPSSHADRRCNRSSLIAVSEHSELDTNIPAQFFRQCSWSFYASATHASSFLTLLLCPQWVKVYLFPPQNESWSGIVSICIKGGTVEALFLCLFAFRIRCFRLPTEGSVQILWVNGRLRLWFEAKLVTIALLWHIL